MNDKMKSRNEAIYCIVREFAKLLPKLSESSETSINAIFINLKIPQRVCFLISFRDMD